MSQARFGFGGGGDVAGPDSVGGRTACRVGAMTSGVRAIGIGRFDPGCLRAIVPVQEEISGGGRLGPGLRRDGSSLTSGARVDAAACSVANASSSRMSLTSTNRERGTPACLRVKWGAVGHPAYRGRRSSGRQRASTVTSAPWSMAVALDTPSQVHGLSERQRGAAGLPPDEPVARDVDQVMSPHGPVPARDGAFGDPLDHDDGVDPCLAVRDGDCARRRRRPRSARTRARARAP